MGEQVYMEDKNKKSKIVSKKILPIGLQHKIVASSGTFVGPAKEIVCPAKEEFYKYLCKRNPERPCANTHGEELSSWFTWIAPSENKNIQTVDFHVACGHEKKLAYKCRPGKKVRCSAEDVKPGGACEYNTGEECGPVSHGKLIVVGKSKQSCASKQKIKNNVRVNFDFNDTAKSGTLVVDVSNRSQFEAPIFEQDVSLFVSQWLSSAGANRARASITKLDIVNKKTKGGPVPYKFVAKFRTDTDVVQQPANQQCRPCCGQWSAWTSCNRPSKCKTGQRFSIFLESNKTKGHRKCPNFVSKQCGQTCTTTIKNTQTTPTTVTCKGRWVEQACAPCQDRQTGEGTRLRQWKVDTPGVGECLDISEENEFNSLKIKKYKEKKEPMKCTTWNGRRCPEGGRQNFEEIVNCIKRDEIYTGHYAFRSGFTDVPTYETVTKTPFYKDIIKINVFGEEQSSKFNDKSVSVTFPKGKLMLDKMFPKDHYLPKCYTDQSYNFIIKNNVGWYTNKKKEQARCLINPVELNPIATPTRDTTSPSQHALEWSPKEKKKCVEG